MTKAIAKIIRDGRCPKNLHDRGKEFHNSDMQKFLKAQHQLLFYVFLNEGRRTVQLYVEERHVETIYAQWKLQMD